MTQPTARTSYDEVPYMGRVHYQTHIERSAIAAQLFEVKHPPLESARVLELGCGDGSNIIYMAAELPKATFIGIDASAVQIERGTAICDEAGLSNVELLVGDIATLKDHGNFDYILCTELSET